MRKKIEPEDISLNSQSASGQDQLDDRLLTVREAAYFLQIQPSSLYHLISAKRVPTIHLSSRCVRFSRKALAEWVESMTEPATGGDLYKKS